MSRYGISMPAVKMRKIVQVGNKLGTVKTSMGPFFRFISGMRLRTASQRGGRRLIIT